MFWHIDHVWLFYLLACLAAGICLAGLGIHLKVWRKSAPKDRSSFSAQAVKRSIIEIILGRRIFRGDIAAGAAHLFLFWGFVTLLVGTSLLAVHGHVYPFLTGNIYLLFAFSMELGGLSLLVGLIWALVRRYIQRVPRLERRLEDAIVPPGSWSSPLRVFSWRG